jgi:hypothetical protein
VKDVESFSLEKEKRRKKKKRISSAKKFGAITFTKLQEFCEEEKDPFLKSNYSILLEYNKCVLPPLT